MSVPTILFIQNYATDPPHLVAEWLKEIGFTTEVIRTFDGEDIPQVLSSDVAAIIPLGGAMNAMQDAEYPWLADEKKLIKRSVDEGLPVLGICLGAQLLGAALGGTVSRLDANEIGIYEINQIAADPIINLGESAPTTQWHEDYVSVLPAGATLIANSSLCPTQIFKVGELSYGLQCHPEADASIVALWEAKPDNAFSNFEGASGEVTIASTVEAREYDLLKTWKPIIQSWGRAVLDRSAIK
jgi:GMP synthase-like glutamine amidotransferase